MVGGESEELIERLYVVPPESFVAARAQAVAAARAAGDPAGARRIAKLRRPTVAAWLVNLLAIRRPELMAELAELAERLRLAQRDLRGEDLRELTVRRRAVVGVLVTQARQLARHEAPGLAVQRLPLAEVEATLQAALADTGIAEQVRAGRLEKATSYAGFGEVPRPRLRLITGAGPESVPIERRAADHEPAEVRARRLRRRRQLDRDLAEAEAERQRVTAELVSAVRAEQVAADQLVGARTELTTLERQMADVERQLADLNRQLTELKLHQREAERRRNDAEHEVTRRKLARKSAERAAGAADRRRDEARAALDELE